MNVQCLPWVEFQTFSTSLWCLPWAVQLSTLQTCPAADKISRHGLSDTASESSEAIADSVWAAPGFSLAGGWRRARASGRRASIPPAASRGRHSVLSARAGAGGGAAPRRAALQPGPGRGRWMPLLRSCCLPGGLRRPVSAGRPRGGEPGPGGWRGGFGPVGGALWLLLLPCPLEAAARTPGSVPGGAAGLDNPGGGRSGAAGRESAGPVLAVWAPEAG